MITLVESEFGSHVYGTNVPSSDKDFKLVAIPSLNDIILQKAFKAIKDSTSDSTRRNTSDDIDKEIFSLHYFMKLLSEGQTVCLDLMFTPESHYLSKPHECWIELKENRNKLLSKKMRAFASYCQAQAAKYSLKGSYLNAYEHAMNFFQNLPPQFAIKTINLEPLLKHFEFTTTKALNGKDVPVMQIIEISNNKGEMEKYLQVGPKTKIPFNAKCHLGYEIMRSQYEKYGHRAKLAQNNEGIDWKALMHAVRVCDEAIELCQTGNITFPRQNKEHLLKIRKGELNYNNVAEEIENKLLILNQAMDNSFLPEKPDYKFMEDFVLESYKKYAK